MKLKWSDSTQIKYTLGGSQKTAVGSLTLISELDEMGNCERSNFALRRNYYSNISSKPTRGTKKKLEKSQLLCLEKNKNFYHRTEFYLHQRLLYDILMR